MVLRMTALAVIAAGAIGLAHTSATAQEKKATPAEQAKAKKALQEVQDFIGLWNLEGTQKDGAKTIAWKEKVSWGWKFKDGNPSIVADFAEGKGKYFTAGELKYDVEKKKYVFSLTGADKAVRVFEGTVPPTGGLKLESKDAKTGDVYRLTLGTVAEIRYQLKYQKQEGGKGLATDVFAMNGNKDGESFAGGAKKPECIVSGGAANIAVSIGGKQYFVCCTGCRDELVANPSKYIK